MNTYQCHRYHIVFATKFRQPILLPEWELEIWNYFYGIGKAKNIHIYSVGGVEDHIHLLCSIPPSKAVSDAVQELKGNSSKWMKERFNNPEMGWQSGYASFTVSQSAMTPTFLYIKNQRAHHSRTTLDEELKRMVDLHEQAIQH